MAQSIRDLKRRSALKREIDESIKDVLQTIMENRQIKEAARKIQLLSATNDVLWQEAA